MPNGASLPAYFQLNLSVSHDFDFASTGKLHTQLAVINALDRSYEIRDGSGIGVGAPQFGPRRGVYLTRAEGLLTDPAPALAGDASAILGVCRLPRTMPIHAPHRLPEPSADERAHSDHLLQLLREQIAAHGPMPFSQYMERCLYTPGLGYYSAGKTKFGAAGDFVTAPELGELFARCVVQAVQPVLAQLGDEADFLELGGGSGAFAEAALQGLCRERRAAAPVPDPRAQRRPARAPARTPARRLAGRACRARALAGPAAGSRTGAACCSPTR